MNYKNNPSSTISHSKLSPSNRRKSPKSPHNQQFESGTAPASPIKYLLQNNIKLNMGKQGQRTQQQLQTINHLLQQSTIFSDLSINISQPVLCKQLCKNIILIYCQSPHIMQIKDNEIYIFFEGQGFEYMQNNFTSSGNNKYHLLENNQYVMLRKINTNQYFLSVQESNVRYHHANQQKYQLMVDENTLIGKFSEEIFHRVFQNRIAERQKNIVAILKKVQIFNGLPNSFFQQFSKFISEQKRQQGEKVITRQSRSKFVYFVKSGTAELHYFNQNAKPTIQTNYYISNNRPYSIVNISPFDSFGMEPDQPDTQGQKQVVCMTQCAFLKIDKRLLAIIITSFELQFQQNHKQWSEVNINNQIKGQNYLSPEKQLLLKNVERIRSSERKIRDIKLRYLSSSRTKKEIVPLPLSRQQNFKEPIKEMAQEQENQGISSPSEKRRMIKTTEGRFRSTTIAKFINTYGGADQQKKYDAIRRKLDEERQKHSQEKVNQIQIIALDSNETKTEKLRYTNSFDYKGKKGFQKYSGSTSKIQNLQSSHKFIPRLQTRSLMMNSNSKRDSQLIGVFLDKKIKNQILKKAERVLNINKNVKLAENKNLKRLFAPSATRSIYSISQFDKKSIADDIVQKMSNLRENPLLLQIESQRRKLERQVKLSMRKKANESPSPNKRYKKQDQTILIRDYQ